MRAELLELAADLARRGEPFVLATVVRRESYSSAHQGDMAVITADGAYPAYLAVVASRKRFAQLRESLLARGVAAAALDGIKNPAGLDIGARLPEEVALSILAEIVQLRRTQADALAPEPVPAARSEI